MKYMGSKGRIVDDILPVMLDKYNGSTFVDVFCGGCSVIENVPDTYERIANDVNRYLIAMWIELTINGTEDMPKTIERDFYCDVRDSYNKRDRRYSDSMKGWVGFMGSFNGRFFDGGYSGHNVVGKNGKSRNYISENINNTLSQVEKLKGVHFTHCDFEALYIPEHSLIYCDPPYKGTKQYTIWGVGKNGEFKNYKDFDYERFYNWCRRMKKQGHLIFISEYEMPEDFKCIWSKQITNAMHQTNTKKPIEKLFTI